MGELAPYLRLLSERGPSVAARELRSRIFREPPKKAIRRVMDVCERRHATFTFFIVGVCANDNPDMIEEILSRGHEIACHGYEHQRFDLLGHDEIRRDLASALDVFEKGFGYTLKSFRAPYLKMAERVYPILKEMGFEYSSSIEGPAGSFEHPSGVVEFPISVDDWRILIKEHRGVEGLSEELSDNEAPHACFLLHPWRVGQRRYIASIERLLGGDGGTYSFPALSDLSVTDNGVALTGDIGEFSLWELLRRSVRDIY